MISISQWLSSLFGRRAASVKSPEPSRRDGAASPADAHREAGLEMVRRMMEG